MKAVLSKQVTVSFSVKEAQCLRAFIQNERWPESSEDRAILNTLWAELHTLLYTKVTEVN